MNRKNKLQFTPICYDIEKVGKIFKATTVNHHWMFVIKGTTHDVNLEVKPLSGSKILKINGKVNNKASSLFNKEKINWEFWLDKVFFQLKTKGPDEYDLLVDHTPFSILLNQSQQQNSFANGGFQTNTALSSQNNQKPTVVNNSNNYNNGSKLNPALGTVQSSGNHNNNFGGFGSNNQSAGNPFAGFGSDDVPANQGNINNSNDFTNFGNSNPQQQQNMSSNPFDDLGIEQTFNNNQPQQKRQRRKIFDDEEDLKMREHLKNNIQNMRNVVNSELINNQSNPPYGGGANFWAQMDAESSKSQHQADLLGTQTSSTPGKNPFAQFDNAPQNQNQVTYQQPSFNNNMNNTNNANNDAFANFDKAFNQPQNGDPWAEFGNSNANNFNNVSSNDPQVQNKNQAQNNNGNFGGDGFLDLQM